MSVNIPTHFVEEYTSTLQLLLQQTDSKFSGTVSGDTHVGDQAVPVDQIGAVEMSEVATRFEPKQRTDAPTDRRWVFPTSFDLQQLLDSVDKLKILSDPQGAYMQNALQAANRKKDDVIIDAFFGTAKTGRSGATSTTFPAGQQIAVTVGAAAATGLNYKKLREVSQLFLENEVDLEANQLWMAIAPAQHDDLLGQVEVISTDFNSTPVVVDGKVKQFMGINLIVTNRLPVNGSSQRRCPVWIESGMHLGMWQDISATIRIAEELRNNPVEVYTFGTFGATRLEEEKVAEVICAE